MTVTGGGYFFAPPISAIAGSSARSLRGGRKGTMGMVVTSRVAGNRTFISAEGLVKLAGPGKVYLQTRSQGVFLSWLTRSFRRRAPTDVEA